jgi:hypothetical protein
LLHHHLRIEALSANLLLQPLLFFGNIFLEGFPTCASIIHTLNNISEPSYPLCKAIFLNLCQLLHSDIKLKCLTRVELKSSTAITLLHHLFFFPFFNPFS